MLLSKSLEGFKFACLAKGNSPETQKGYDWAFKIISDYFQNPELDNIQAKDLQRFFLHLHTESGLASSSIQKVWTAIRAFYNWAENELEIERPDRNIPMPKADTKEVIPFTEEEVLALLKVIEYSSRSTSIRDKAIILVLLDTGLRVSELARLKIRDISLENGSVEVRPYRTGHKSKTRVVFLGVKARKAVWRYLADRESSREEYLFLSRDGNPMNRNSIRQLLERIGERAKIKSVHPHRFRHTFAVNLLRNGADVFTLQYFLGHSSLEMVKKYVRIANLDSERIFQKSSPVDNWKIR